MGIKSFTGKRAKPQNASEKIKVSDYMTRNLITFKPEQLIRVSSLTVTYI